MNQRELAKLFNRIPDDVVLRVSSRDMRMGDGLTCLCGWALRESLSSLTGRAADDIGLADWNDGITVECQKQFGGNYADWAEVYWGVVDPYGKLQQIENAWANRLDRAVERSER